MLRDKQVYLMVFFVEWFFRVNSDQPELGMPQARCHAGNVWHQLEAAFTNQTFLCNQIQP